MREFKTWSWGFVPAIAALCFIWFEFWQADRRERPALSQPASLAASPAPETRVAAAPAVSGSPTTKPAGPAVAPPPVALPANQDVDPRLFIEPPPVSLTVTQVSLGDLAKALNTALNTPVIINAPDARDLHLRLGSGA